MTSATSKPTLPTPPRDLMPARPVEVVAAAPAAPVWVILPVYNDSAAAESVVTRVAEFAAAHPEYQFVFVDDGSSDGSATTIAAAIAAAGERHRHVAARLRLISYRANGGKGHAVARGVASIRGGDDDPVIFTDGDLAYSLDHLPTLVHALQTADVVIGSRRGHQGGYGAHPLRYFMGWAYNRMARLCLGAPYRDTQAGLKGFRLRAARQIFSALRVTGFGFDVELLYLARRFGLRIAEVPARVGEFHKGKPSRVNLLREPRRMFMNLLGVRLNGLVGTYDRPGQGRVPLAAISFDAEEFDIPTEFGATIPPARQMEVAGEGMRRALALLEDVPARATFFMTAAFARAHPDLVARAVAAGHEIASHSRIHTGFTDADLEISRRELEEIAGVPVRGFRRPRFAPTDPARILAAGYTYDSSLHPTWIPGRYNGLRQPRRAFVREGLARIPLSVTPLIRWPLFWLAFKNSPAWSTRLATRAVLAADGCVTLCFHPWELCELEGFGLPRYLRRIDGRSMSSRLIRHFRWLSRRATLVTYSQLEDRLRARVWPFGEPVLARSDAPAHAQA